MIGKDHAEGGVAPRFPIQFNSAADLIEQLLYDRHSQSHTLSLALGRHPEEIFEDVGEGAGSGSASGEGDHHAFLFRKISYPDRQRRMVDKLDEIAGEVEKNSPKPDRIAHNARRGDPILPF